MVVPVQTRSLLVTTNSLSIGVEQTGSETGEAIVLLHGFPYSARSFDRVRDLIARHDRRILTPHLRGFGLTRYRSEETFRSGQQAALGKDVIDLLDALGIERATLVGYDWGGRAACVAAALWPERVRALVAVGGYTIQDIARAAITPKGVEQEHQYWYQWYFQMERGRAGLTAHREEIGRCLWKMWSPGWAMDESLFAATAKSFDNPDFVATVIHSYRHRYANAPGDPQMEDLEKQLAAKPKIHAPTIVLHGDDDRVEPPSSSEGKEAQFSGHYERRLLKGIGHCPPQEAPEAVSDAIDDVLRIGEAE